MITILINNNVSLLSCSLSLRINFIIVVRDFIHKVFFVLLINPLSFCNYFRLYLQLQCSCYYRLNDESSVSFLKILITISYFKMNYIIVEVSNIWIYLCIFHLSFNFMKCNLGERHVMYEVHVIILPDYVLFS